LGKYTGYLGIFSPNGEKEHIVDECGKNNLNAKTGKKIPVSPKKSLELFSRDLGIYPFFAF